jgi:hypothetical protein
MPVGECHASGSNIIFLTKCTPLRRRLSLPAGIGRIPISKCKTFEALVAFDPLTRLTVLRTLLFVYPTWGERRSYRQRLASREANVERARLPYYQHSRGDKK